MCLAIPLILVLNNFAFFIPNLSIRDKYQLNFHGHQNNNRPYLWTIIKIPVFCKTNAFLLLNIYKQNNINFIFTINNYGLLSLN